MKKILIILGHAVVGWIASGAIVFIGMILMSEENALIAHAIITPFIFFGLTLYYVKNYNYTIPFLTAVIFIAVVVLLDVFVVAKMMHNSMDMFRDVLATWLPFVLIFLTTYFTGITARDFYHTEDVVSQ